MHTTDSTKKIYTQNKYNKISKELRKKNYMEIHYTGIKVSVSTFEIHKSLWLMVFACPSEKKENTETDEK